MEEEKYEMALYIGSKVEWSLGDPAFVINVSICKILEGTKIRNFVLGEPWDDIEFDERHYLSNRGPGEYEVNQYFKMFYCGYHPEIKDLERALKSLKTIQRGLDRIYQEEGPVSDFAHHLQRISKALKIKKWVWIVGKDAGWHQQNEHKIASVPDGMYHVRRLTLDNKEWQKVIKDKNARLAA